ncbi:AAA family ATPase [Tissierella sp. Yu-01]|uniref:AAA family ATPase n=1 Tax=Tissierella sp. Yu-01 TaxID=3035694 RepID=UPI00240E2490|nr:AAA family ATPase [Tissierella sp. Yu-01]WFA09197.1 AAA family ATPase [Tissierella sp. Yu-01]
MNRTLYVYNYQKINELKLEFSNKHFISFGFIFNMASEIDNIELLDDYFDDCIVDISVLAFDTGYYRFFIERYLYALINKFDNIKFAVVSENKNDLLNRFTYFFSDINEQFSIDTNDNMQVIDPIEHDSLNYSIENIPLVLYNKSMLNNGMKKYKVISIGCLFSGADNLSYKFNSENIKQLLKSEDFQYIDITPVIDLFKIRSDLVLAFEILLRQIYIIKKETSFLICDELLDEIKKYLPFTFRIDNALAMSEIDETKSNDVFLDVEETKRIADLINNSLKGHDEFKKDFEFNLKKFVFLNELKERKIFSIFLTGESGIGKTEFAKMLSDIMYPKQDLIKINFENYSTEGVLNSLIGSPLGYIGSTEGGELINKMKVSKSKIVLIDEFEKATPSVFHFFYELLEDGKFTDRHGIEHNLDGYIIIFTSNMTRKRYIESVPNPLKSRFDMVYCFVELPPNEKERFVIGTATDLISKIFKSTNVTVDISCVSTEMNSLIKNNNLRSIKRKIEDIIIAQYYTNINQ